MGFEDLKQSVLHAVLLAPGLQGGRWNTYVCVCVPMGTPRAGARSIPWAMFYGQFFYAK
jgi:hypothetical protein